MLPRSEPQSRPATRGRTDGGNRLDGRYKFSLSGLSLALSVGVSSVLSFAVHALASRQLSVADYGGLAAVLAIMTAGAVPVGAVQTALTRSAAEIQAMGGKPSGRTVLRRTIPVGLAIVGVTSAIAPAMARFLDLRTSVPIVLGAIWIAVVLVGSVGKGLLIAVSAHKPVAHAIFHGSVVRLGLAAAFTPSLGISGGIAAAVLGDVFASAIYWWAAARRGLLRADGTSVRVEWPDAGRALSAQLSLWLFASLAVIVGRRALRGDESGSFAAMATASGACLFLPQALATIVFPRFVADGSRALLLRATALAAAVGTACALALTIRPDLVFIVFFGPHYRPVRSVMVALCAFFVLLGCLTVLTQSVVARRQGGSTTVWLALFTATFAAERYGSSPISVAVAVLVPSVVATGAVALRAAFTLRSPSTTPCPHTLQETDTSCVCSPAVGTIGTARDPGTVDRLAPLSATDESALAFAPAHA
jgi:O-antigen/teichoic acid export membrane protein